MSGSSLSATVLHNLNHYNLWTELRQINVQVDGSSYDICAGRPPKKLHPDDPDGELAIEYVLPARSTDKWTIRQWNQVFTGLKNFLDLETVPRRIVMAVVAEDSTVVYYFVNSGLVKPRKN